MPISKETLDFWGQTRLKNPRDWFHDHKKTYQEVVLAPLTELVEKLAPVMWEIDPLLITTPKVCKTISRIYRDTRYTKDKSLYREVMWIVFTRDKKQYESPCGFVMEFSPNGFRYGCGYWQAPPDIMAAMRELVLKNDPAFRAAKEAYDNQTVFQLEGDCYKRSRFPEQPEELQQWLDRKNIDFMHNSKDFQLLFSDRLADVLIGDFPLLKPIYELFLKAEMLARHPQE